jgi:hypothetical protein
LPQRHHGPKHRFRKPKNPPSPTAHRDFRLATTAPERQVSEMCVGNRKTLSARGFSPLHPPDLEITFFSRKPKHYVPS